MARRGVSPTELVVGYFLNGDLVAVEQALVIATAIIKNRREKETSVALGSPAPRRRRRKATPEVATGVQTGTAPGAVEPPAAAAVTTTTDAPAATTAPRRRRTRTAPAAGAEAPKRTRRRRGTSGATPPMGTGTTAAGPVAVPAPALPAQLGEGDEGYEPISVNEG
jgi:hypothetical protein